MKTARVIVFTFVAGILSVCSARAQFLSDSNGANMTAKHYEDVHGSPYLADDWLPGTVKLATGETYKDNLSLKYNVADDELYFKSQSGDPLTFVQPVSEFTITTAKGTLHFKNGFKVATYSEKAFFEVLSDGTVQLLKRDQKAIIENKPYNSATTEKIFNDVSQYFLVSNGKAVEVKKDKKAILAAIGNKQPQLDAYAKSSNLNLKNDTDLGKLVTYYNSL